MEEHKLAIVEWVNRAFGTQVAPLFGLHELPMHVVMATVVLIFSTVFFLVARRRFSVENPGGLQLLLEGFIEFLETQILSNIGHKGLKYLNLIGALAFFILFSNLLGLVPGFGAPTSNVNVPAGLAIVVFLYYHFEGIRAQGVVHYAKHFAGPVWWLAPLMIPIEIISHLARPLSLTVRLFANIFAEEMVVVVFFTIFAFLLPLPFMAYAVFGGILQTFIFITLSQLYLGGAIATEEHH